MERINHPKHYSGGGIEAMDVIYDWRLDFIFGNAVKYIMRAGRKPGSPIKEDLKKARWYLAYALENYRSGDYLDTSYGRCSDIYNELAFTKRMGLNPLHVQMLMIIKNLYSSNIDNSKNGLIVTYRDNVRKIISLIDSRLEEVKDFES